MDIDTRIKIGSEFANVIAYHPDIAPPPGFIKVTDLYWSLSSGFMATTFYNNDTRQVVVAIAGTNDRFDIDQWPSATISNSYNRNKAQVDDAVVLFQRVATFASERGENVMTAAHSLGGCTQILALHHSDLRELSSMLSEGAI